MYTHTLSPSIHPLLVVTQLGQLFVMSRVEVKRKNQREADGFELVPIEMIGPLARHNRRENEQRQLSVWQSNKQRTDKCIILKQTGTVSRLFNSDAVVRAPVICPQITGCSQLLYCKNTFARRIETLYTLFGLL